MDEDYNKKRNKKKEQGEIRFGVELGFFRSKRGMKNYVDSLCYKHNLDFDFKKFHTSLFTTKMHFKVIGNNADLKKFAYDFDDKYDIEVRSEN